MPTVQSVPVASVHGDRILDDTVPAENCDDGARGPVPLEVGISNEHAVPGRIGAKCIEEGRGERLRSRLDHHAVRSAWVKIGNLQVQASESTGAGTELRL